MFNVISANPFKAVFLNDFDTNGRAFIPELWAEESLMVLEANMVATSLVHRDFENEVKSYGDVVNTRKPGTFEARRKVDGDDVTIQPATATKVQVKLDQFIHTSFIIYDSELSRSFKDLVTEYLTPAIQSLAVKADKIILGQAYQFMGNSVGKLGTDLTKATVISANTLMNTNKVPASFGDRKMILTPGAEGALLNIQDFTRVNEAGDGGAALTRASLGSKFNFDFFMCQNTPSIAATQTTNGATVNLSAGYAAASTTIAITGYSGAITAGTWCTIAGDMTPQMITATVGDATPTSMTISPGLKSAVAHGATVTMYPTSTVNYSDGYAAGYSKELATAAFASAPLSGQLVSFGTTTPRYSAIDATPTTINLGELDHSLDAALTHGDVVGVGPAGDYCLAFHKNAISFVNRPLVTVPSNVGALQAVANYNDLSVRITFQYQGTGQGMLVTADMLCGVKTLDSDLGCIVYC